tara:strand:- start:490 stop:918 length:429 start_codon:yes stop_codon:yes gene_type:complete
LQKREENNFNNMIDYIPLICSSVIVGIVSFQSILVAPSVNKIISKNDASIFLRFIWPRFFLLIGFLSLINLLTIYIYKLDLILVTYFSLISSTIMFFCYFITPFINTAKDNSNNKMWFSLHLITIILTLTALILNIMIITQF